MLHTVDIVSELTFPCNGVRCSSTLTIDRQSKLRMLIVTTYCEG